MPFVVTLPKLSPTMTEGTIAKWHFKEGEHVNEGDVLVEIATDKATVEFRALDAGWLRKIALKERESGPINHPIALFTESQEESLSAESLDQLKPVAPKASASTESSSETSSPKLASVQPQAGAQVDTQLGNQLGAHSDLAPALFTPAPPLPSLKPSSKRAPEVGHIAASPLAKKLARDQRLDLSTVAGTGPGGRIVSRDLDQAQPESLISFSRCHSEPQIPSGTFEEIPLSPMRKIIAQRLQQSKAFIPHFYLQQTINAEPMIEMRQQLARFKHMITFNDLIVRATALALKEHPGVNAGFHAANQTIISFKTIDISIAVSVEGGLITPILRHADYKNLSEISAEVRRLAERARQGKLQEEEYRGGSFSISNLGMFGTEAFCAVINPPQGAILAVGAIKEAAVVKNERVVPGKQLTLTLSLDHRVIDGALGAEFLATLHSLLENPALLVI